MYYLFMITYYTLFMITYYTLFSYNQFITLADILVRLYIYIYIGLYTGILYYVVDASIREDAPENHSSFASYSCYY